MEIAQMRSTVSQIFSQQGIRTFGHACPSFLLKSAGAGGQSQDNESDAGTQKVRFFSWGRQLTPPLLSQQSNPAAAEELATSKQGTYLGVDQSAESQKVVVAADAVALQLLPLLIQKAAAALYGATAIHATTTAGSDRSKSSSTANKASGEAAVPPQRSPAQSAASISRASSESKPDATPKALQETGTQSDGFQSLANQGMQAEAAATMTPEDVLLYFRSLPRDQKFSFLSSCLGRMPNAVLTDMKTRLISEPWVFGGHAALSPSPQLRTCKMDSYKELLVSGLAGTASWDAHMGYEAVAMLAVHDSDDLFTELGFLAMVRLLGIQFELPCLSFP